MSLPRAPSSTAVVLVVFVIAQRHIIRAFTFTSLK